jgi:hypothetical protein
MQGLPPRIRSLMKSACCAAVRRTRLVAELKDKIAALESRVRGHPAAMLGLARMLQQDGQREKALAMCHAALALAPDDAQLAAKVGPSLAGACRNGISRFYRITRATPPMTPRCGGR